MKKMLLRKKVLMKKIKYKTFSGFFFGGGVLLSLRLGLNSAGSRFRK